MHWTASTPLLPVCSVVKRVLSFGVPIVDEIDEIVLVSTLRPSVGAAVVGDDDEDISGPVLGEIVGAVVGDGDGDVLGAVLSTTVGANVVGEVVGARDGADEGLPVGDCVGCGTRQKHCISLVQVPVRLALHTSAFLHRNI